MIIAVINQKGGVGKTTTVANVGAALARLLTGPVRRGAEVPTSVLLVDLDPQASLTALAEPEMERSLSNLPGIQVVSATARSLPRVLEKHPYQFALLDCPPALGQAQAQALLAADLALAPMPPKFLDAHGLAQLVAAVEQAQMSGNPRLDFRVVLTMKDARQTTHRELETGVRGALGGRVLQTVVPYAAVFDRAALAQTAAVALEPSSPGAKAYLSLARELMEVSERSDT